MRSVVVIVDIDRKERQQSQQTERDSQVRQTDRCVH